MNYNLRKFAALLLVALIALLAIGPAPVTQARNSNPRVIPPQAHPYGHTYAEWTAALWQWILSIPAPRNPGLDTTGEFCAEAQSGHVWFLVGSFIPGTMTLECTVPPGKALFISPMFVEWSTLETPGATEEQLRAIANEWADRITDAQVLVDGVPVVGVFDNFRFETELFGFTVPEDNLFGLPPQSGVAVADGYGVMLAPLPPGEHTIHLIGSATWNGGFVEDITYNLTVSPHSAP